MSMTMGKEASLDGLEFDGDTVLCRVCGDKASGFHYGVHACEGCKLTTSVGFLLDSMFDFAERFNKLALNDDEIALFSAVVLLSPDRPGLRQIDPIEKIQNKLTESLQNMINTTHKEDSTLFAKLLMKTTDLRTLNALHAEKEVGAEKAEDNVKMQDSQVEPRSECSTPSDTSSSVTYASGSTMDTSSIYDSNGSLGQASNRLTIDGLQHGQQQVVLKTTPYGTFYREDGYYGMVPEQPRRRCHTLDRDSQISRPRLHTIEEGGRRRYTMDREYISKMVNKLSEKRGQVNSMPGSINNSAASSPVPILEEQHLLMNTNRDFIPIATPDSNPSSTRTSPSFHKDLLQPFSSSPNSPRPRSGSMGTDDFGPQMRPRCSSFHLNSEGHAAQSRLYPNADADFLTTPDGHHFRMSADMRRGSVGASHNLHAKKKSLLVDRHPGYLSQIPADLMFRKFDKQRSPLANEDPNKAHHVGSGSSAFEQVPRLNIWSGGAQLEPPKVSVTGPNDEHHNILGPGQERATATITSDGSKSPYGSARNSPEVEIKSEDMYHKKFDKMRKHMMAEAAGHVETAKMENLSIQDQPEAMESESSVDIKTSQTFGNVRIKQEKMRKSAVESHPQLLAQLNSGPQIKPAIQGQYPPGVASSSSAAASQIMPQNSLILQQQLQQNSQNFPQKSPYEMLDSEKGAARNGNVVLNVPQTMFGKIHQPNMAAMSTMAAGTSPNGCNMTAGNHRHLENMLRKNVSTGNKMADQQQYLANSQPLRPSNQHPNLKEKLACPFTNMNKNIKYENDTDKSVRNGNVAGDFLNYHSGQAMMGPGYQIRPGFESQAMIAAPHMGMYPGMFGHQTNAGAQFNQHLAGMQQMVYGSGQTQRQENSDELPLNLAQGQGHSEQQQQQQQLQCPIKIKEEVIS